MPGPGRDSSGRWVRHQSGRAGIRGSSISVDLPSQHVEQVCKGRNDLNRREHDDGHHHRQHGDPGPPGPTGQPRTRDEHSGRCPGLEWRPRMRDERRTDPLLPSNSHPHRFPSRADPPPRQLAGSPVPVIERLDSIIQARRREQLPQESLVCRSSVAHAVQFLAWAKRYVERAPKSAYLDQITTDRFGGTAVASRIPTRRRPKRNATGMGNCVRSSRRFGPAKRISALRPRYCAPIARAMVRSVFARLLLGLRDHPAAAPAPTRPCSQP